MRVTRRQALTGTAASAAALTTGVFHPAIAQSEPIRIGYLPVLLVEHHADLIFDICDRVTVLNLGKVLASGTPVEIRSHREVVNAYLGS
jgi:ABC-type branched-subunit amino acid transport system ATPase component